MSQKTNVKLRARFHEGGINNCADIRDGNYNHLGEVLIGFSPEMGIEIMSTVDGAYVTEKIKMPSEVQNAIEELLNKSSYRIK